MRKLMTFQDLEQIWQEQSPVKNSVSSEHLIAKANSSLKRMHKKQQYSIGILAITCLILIFFYLSIEAYKSLWTGFGLLVMIGCLILRIAMEIYQNNQLRQMDASSDFQTYLKKHKTYFQRRQWVHFGFTPLVYLLYFGGFWMMLPTFKASLSSGFYAYILVSGSLVFVGLAGFIAYHIQKELRELKFFEDLISK